MTLVRAIVIAFVLVCSMSCVAGSDATAAWVARVDSANVEADRAVAANRPADALAALQAAREVPIPGEVQANDRRVVRQDLAFRIATLEVALGQGAAAVATASAGLNEGDENDLFVANLYVVRGNAREATGDDRAAADDYFHALEINQHLLDEALGDNR